MVESLLAIPGAIAIGISLGLLGSGGSVLTVPVLVYLVGQDEKVAIAGSLFIVGSIALVGSLQFVRARLIQWRSVAIFGLPGMAGTWFGAFLAGWIPGITQLVLFAVVMLLASWLMLKPPDLDSADKTSRVAWKIAIDGSVVGVITGLVGVGGGFLIVPALVLLGGLTMHQAVASSLVIIAMKSFSGFYKYLDVLEQQGLELDWPTLILVAGLGVAGSFAGSYLAKRVPQQKLRIGFGYFLIVMAGYILIRSVPGALELIG